MPIRPDDEELTLKTGGKTLDGWTNFQVTRGIEQCPSAFAIGLSERYPGQAHKAIVAPFSSCEVFLSGALILTGSINHYAPAMNAQDHQASIQGRSKTEDLVDCSVNIEDTGWEISAATIGEAAKKICRSYSIEVTGDGVDVALDTKYPFIVNPGASCWQLLEQVARAGQVLIWDDPQGRLVLSKIGTKRAATALVEGGNAEIAGALFTSEGRYSDYWVPAMSSVAGTDGHFTTFAKTKDERTPRKRILMILMDMPGPDRKWAEQRVAWEKARRYGRSRQIQVTVVGWRDGNDQLWTPNTLTRVHCPTLKIDEDWLITACSWRRSEQGTQTVMHLMPPDGVRPAPFHPLLPIPLE